MKTATALEIVETALREHCEIAAYGDHPQQEKIQSAFLHLEKIAKRRYTVHVRGGVAYCDSPAVRIIDHDNH